MSSATSDSASRTMRTASRDWRAQHGLIHMEGNMPTNANHHKSASEQPPWDKENPKHETGEKAHHLSPAEKASAKRSAKAAGRPYPNLVDNMRAASKQHRASKMGHGK